MGRRTAGFGFRISDSDSETASVLFRINSRGRSSYRIRCLPSAGYRVLVFTTALAIRSLLRRVDHSDLPAAVSSPMREESVVVALRAARADADVDHAQGARLLRDERAEIDGRRNVHPTSGQALVHVRTDLVAFAADGRTAVQMQVARGESERQELTDGELRDVRCRAAPA